MVNGAGSLITDGHGSMTNHGVGQHITQVVGFITEADGYGHRTDVIPEGVRGGGPHLSLLHLSAATIAGIRCPMVTDITTTTADSETVGNDIDVTEEITTEMETETLRRPVPFHKRMLTAVLAIQGRRSIRYP